MNLLILPPNPGSRLSLSSSASYSWPDPTRLVLRLGRIHVWATVIVIGLFSIPGTYSGAML